MTVLITGGAGGIGSAAAEYFLSRGANAAIADIDEARLRRVEERLQAYRGSMLAIRETVAEPEGADRIVRETAARFGAVDVLINNAALVRDQLLLRMSIRQFDEVVDANLKGAFYCAKSAVPFMIERGGGRIINMIAASGLGGNPGQTNYAAAKGGLLAMTLTWSAELRKRGIAVNAVIPAAWTLMSESIPEEVLLKAVGRETLERMKARKPSQVAPLLGFLASPEGAEVTGQCLAVGGTKLSVWGYARPVAELEAAGECFGEEEIGRFLRESMPQSPPPALF
ncbi:SDR family NAD(P)-dependent oxidoreductase [Cohnella caldifontis]|uniref:SDR family NAD(P)-dependent oxidoreductase n=1 Tax=Cohnella caldifontis TaxID=3027471 RepID=UPI0023EC6E51|nr:SDR family NAD(P)-dependent oxidoreductase [Cohnella sp. YIM B05605]